jgi:glyoxylase-like metal-dependent hydrolase (beta-lactamase superfamily II)
MAIAPRAATFIMAACASLCGCAESASISSSPLPGDTVARDVSVLRGAFVAGRQPDGNTVLLRASDGWIVVDSGRHAAHAQRIIDAVRASGQPVAAIVNTHWHLDHVAGNVPLRAAYPRAEVHAGEAIRDAMSGFLSDYRRQLVELIARAPADSADAIGWREELARIDAGTHLYPTHAVTSAGARTVAGRRLWLGLERNAVSGGDVWLLDPSARVLVAGDLVTLPAPLFDTACPDGWREALARIEREPFDVLVPGHGAPLSRAQFALYRRAFDRLLDCAAGDAGKEVCAAGWLEDARPLIPADDIALARTSLDYYLDLLRTPQAQRTRWCRA